MAVLEGQGCHAGVSAGEARTVEGPVAGARFNVVSTVDVVTDLRGLQGRYIQILAVDNAIDFVFVASPTDVMDTANTFDIKERVPDYLPGCGAFARIVVPHLKPYLLIRSNVSGETAEVRVRRT